MLIAEFTLGNALLTVLEFFFLVIWIWIYVAILGDLFRDHEISGWGKAAWVFFLIFVPFVTPLIYLIARGNGMRDRAIKHQAESKKHFDAYVRQSAGSSPVDELGKLNDLKEKGAISEAEYQQQKAKVLA